MTSIKITVDFIVEIPNSTPSTRVKRVIDSQGTDRTADFLKFCESHNHPLAKQIDVEFALNDFVTTHAATLP
jgi:hypothetical protein